ncbi:MAG TPA: cob(I)yrinic acid a,c-diamide adenosyltransferase [archaeon]|nr:cob(I)yrinic acid a,c-diamide adenosyltransferase [archaeon]
MQPKKWPGDFGKTKIMGTHEMDKDAPTFEAIGAVDELNSFIGLVINRTSDGQVEDILKGVQKDLFIIGAELAGSPRREDKSTNLDPDHVVRLEEVIYELDQSLKPLSSFILPGGSEESSYIHVARSICRRAERNVIRLKKEKIINDDIVKYLNRLSYLLFQLARRINEKHGIDEHKW